MNPWPISPLRPKDLDFAVVNYDFTTFTGNSLSDLPNLLTDIDGILADLSSSIADQNTLFESIPGDFTDMAGILNELGGDGIVGIITDIGAAGTAGDSLLGDYATSVGDNSPPQPPGGGGGGTGGGGGGPATGCGTHGGSNLGSFNQNDFEIELALPVASLKDGPCTFKTPLEGVNLGPNTNVFVSFTLTSGDATLFKLSGGHLKPTTFRYQDYFAVTVTPTQTGHFVATGLLVTGSPSQRQRVYISLDVIP